MEPTLPNLIFGLVVFALFFGVLERLWPARPGQPLMRAGLGTDIVYWFFTPLVTKGATRLALAVVLVGIAAAAGVPLDRGHLDDFLRPSGAIGALPWGVQLALLLVLTDALAYITHRWFHGRMLWPFHAVHHSSPEVDWLSSVRLHPVNDAVVRLAQAVPVVLLGFDTTILLAYFPFLIAYGIFVHANLPISLGPLRFVIATPVFHRWHHAAQGQGIRRNFAGLFPVFDLIGGTFYMPEGKTPQSFGVPDRVVPQSIAAQLWYPFRRGGSGAGRRAEIS